MKYLTKQEVADTLRVTVRTVSTYIAKGMLPAHKKLGRRLLWDEAEIFQCIQSSNQIIHCSDENKLVKRGRPRKLIS